MSNTIPTKEVQVFFANYLIQMLLNPSMDLEKSNIYKYTHKGIRRTQGDQHTKSECNSCIRPLLQDFVV